MKKCFTIDDSLKIKGIAILLMIFHHLFRLKEFSYGFDVSFFPLTIGRTAQIATFFKICVPIFVFLSGYGLLHSYKKMKNKRNFFIKRYFKLMPTFWFTVILCFFVLQLTNTAFVNYYFSNNIYYGVTNLLFDFLGINGLLGKSSFSGNWCYVGASLIFIFLLPVIYAFAKKYGWFNVGLAIVIIPRIFNVSSPSTTTALPYIFSFYLGMLSYDIDLFRKVKNLTINKCVKFFVYIFSLLVLYLIHTHYPRNILWELHFGFIPLVFIMFCYEYIINVPVISFCLRKLGKYSYVMFLVHGFIIDYAKGFIYSFEHMFLIFLILTVISFVIAFIIELFMRLIRYNELFDKIEKKYFI